MGGFFRKVAGAFVEFEDSEESEAGSGASLDDITNDSAALLAQLESIQAEEMAPGSGGTSTGDAQPPPIPADGSILSLTAEQVCAAAGIPEGPNAAPKVIKMIAGLAMFPPEQQVVMVRAMDAADESWSEQAVASDADARKAALQAHLQALEMERQTRIQALDAEIARKQETGRQVVAEIDAAIDDLSIQREGAISDTASSVEKLEQQKREVDAAASQATGGINHVINALSGLVQFFGGSDANQT